MARASPAGTTTRKKPKTVVLLARPARGVDEAEIGGDDEEGGGQEHDDDEQADGAKEASTGREQRRSLLHRDRRLRLALLLSLMLPAPR